MHLASLRVKLLAGFGAVLALLIAVSLVGIKGSDRQDAVTRDITHQTAPKQVAAADIRFDLADLYGFQTAYVLGDHGSQRKLFLASLARLRGDLARLRPLLTT